MRLRLEIARHRHDHTQRKRCVVYGGHRCFKHPLTVSSGHGQGQGLAHGQLSFIDWPDRLTDPGWRTQAERANVLATLQESRLCGVLRCPTTTQPALAHIAHGRRCITVHLRFAARRLRRDGPPGRRDSASVALLLQPTRGVRMGDAHADMRCHRAPACSQPALCRSSSRLCRRCSHGGRPVGEHI